jgi:hypothetical protein
LKTVKLDITKDYENLSSEEKKALDDIVNNLENDTKKEEATMINWDTLSHDEQKVIMTISNDLGNYLLMEESLKYGVIDWTLFKYGYNIVTDKGIEYVSEGINFDQVDFEVIWQYYQQIKEAKEEE